MIFRLERGPRVVLTNAQFKALPTTGITILAAPGANKVTLPVMVTVHPTTTSGGYTNINATYCALTISYGAAGTWAATPIFDDSVSTPAITTFSTVFGTGSPGVRFFPMICPYHDTSGEIWAPQPYVADGVSNRANKALVVAIDNNGSGDLTGGHASNTVAFTVTYLVENV